MTAKEPVHPSLPGTAVEIVSRSVELVLFFETEFLASQKILSKILASRHAVSVWAKTKVDGLTVLLQGRPVRFSALTTRSEGCCVAVDIPEREP